MDNKHVLLSSFFPLALPFPFTALHTETKLVDGCSFSAFGNIHSYVTGDFAIYNIPGNIKSNHPPELQILIPKAISVFGNQLISHCSANLFGIYHFVFRKAFQAHQHHAKFIASGKATKPDLPAVR
jgi:hypothetical protein